MAMNHTSPILGLLEPGKDHFRARHKLFGVLQVGKHLLFIPNDLLVQHGIRVRESSGRARGSAKETIQIGALFVWSALGVSVLGIFQEGQLQKARQNTFSTTWH